MEAFNVGDAIEVVCLGSATCPMVKAAHVSNAGTVKKIRPRHGDILVEFGQEQFYALPKELKKLDPSQSAQLVAFESKETK